MPHFAPSTSVCSDAKPVTADAGDLPNGVASGLLANADCTVDLQTYGATTLTGVPLKAGTPLYMGIRRVTAISGGATVLALYP